MSKLVFCFIVFAAFAVSAFCQNQNLIDSLNSALQNRTGGDGFPVLYELTFQYLDRDNEKALAFISAAEESALLSEDSLRIVKSKRVKGQILYKLERLLEALRCLKAAYSIAQLKGFETERMMISNTLGSVNLHLGQFDNALELYFQAFEVASINDNKDYLGTSLNNIGICYYYLSNYDKALVYLHKAVKMGGLNDVVHYTYINISLCYSALFEISKACEYLDKATSQCGSACPDFILMRLKFTSGFLLAKQGNMVAAEADFLSSLAFCEKLNDSRAFLENIDALSGIYTRQGRLKELKMMLERGTQRIQHGVPFPDIVIGIYGRLADLYLKTHQFNRAAHYLERYSELKDSIYNVKLTTRLMDIESKILEKENMKRIKAQENVILLNKTMIDRQRMINAITGLLVLVSVTFLFFLIRSYRQKKSLNTLLETKVRERTNELEESRDMLIRLMQENDMRVNKGLTGLTDCAQTIRGLLANWDFEKSTSAGDDYIQKLHHTSCRLERELDRLKTSARLRLSSKS